MYGRYNFIAHEPGLGHYVGKTASGGAGFCVAEQTVALNEYLATRYPAAQDLAARPHVKVLSPSPRRRVELPDCLPAMFFEPPGIGHEEVQTQLATDERWLQGFDDLLADDQAVLTHHLLAALVASTLRKPFLCNFHSLWPTVLKTFFPEYPNTREELSLQILSSARAVLVSTTFEKKWLIKTAPTKALAARLRARVHVLPIGLNPHMVALQEQGEVHASRAHWRRRLLPHVVRESLVFYTVGRYVPYKNQLRILLAFLRVATEVPATHLLMVGPLTDRDYFQQLLQTLADAPPALRKRVTLRGSQPIEAAHLAGDVLVHASAYESWGRVIDEAFLVGNPTILQAFPTTAERAGFSSVWHQAAIPSADDGTIKTAHFDYAPRGNSAELRSLLIDAGDGTSLEDLLCRAATDAAWRQACGAYNRRAVNSTCRARAVPDLIGIWNSVEREVSGRSAFPLNS